MHVVSMIPLAPIGGGALLVAVISQVRAHINDTRDRKFAERIFEQTDSTDALDGYVRLVKESRRSSRTVPWRRKPQDSGPTEQ